MKADSIHTIAVLGLGTMGHGIAHVFAAAGYQVRGFDDVAAARDSLHARSRTNMKQMADAGVLKESIIEPALKRMKVFASVDEAVTGADFVLEAVREDLPTKQALFPYIEKLVSPRTILASNTSTFPMTKIAARVKKPGRCIVMHWMNPPHLVPLVEIVSGKKTNAATVATTIDLTRRLNKVPVHVRKEVPGFIINRVQVAMYREVYDLLANGVATAEDIDTAISSSMGFRLAAIGPLQVADFGGLDVWRKVINEVVPKIRGDAKVPKLLTQLVAKGHYGPKTGQGIFKYTPETIAAKRADRDRKFLALAKLLYS